MPHAPRLGYMRFYSLEDPKRRYHGKSMFYKTLKGARKGYVANYKKLHLPEQMDIIFYKHTTGENIIHEKVGTISYLYRYGLEDYVYQPYQKCCREAVNKNGSLGGAI